MSGLEVVELKVHVIKVCMYVIVYTLWVDYRYIGHWKLEQQTSHSLSGFVILDIDLRHLQ